MAFVTIRCMPFDDQKPGTSGLRKSVVQFQKEDYLANFVQSIFSVVTELQGNTLILGGDGRYFNREAIQLILRIAAANEIGHVIIGQGGILSTPAVSHLIRQHKAAGGIILSASHNPGGPRGDFGIKFNSANGGPAPEKLTNAIYQYSRSIREYHIAPINPVPLDKPGHYQIAAMPVDIIDPVKDYIRLMESIFNFDKIADLLKKPSFQMRFDAMNAVNGPYAETLFEKHLHAPAGSVIRSQPLTNFGGVHPDPNQTHAQELMALLYGTEGIDFGAASDGDGDRNMILGKHFFVTPSDSLAILAANAQLIPGYCEGITGVARSMPTSQAVDRVAEHLNIPCFETPTGWKFFGNLLDAGEIQLCGEESFGTGSNHIREKDGLWAVLFWLNLLAEKQCSVEAITREHWATYGRNYYSRHDYEGLPIDAAQAVMTHLEQQASQFTNQKLNDYVIRHVDNFSYTDPVDHSISQNQGLRILFENNARLVLRLSGTGTQGATLRIYLEHYEKERAHQQQDTQKALAGLIDIAEKLGHISELTSMEQPTVIT